MESRRFSTGEKNIQTKEHKNETKIAASVRTLSGGTHEDMIKRT